MSTSRANTLLQQPPKINDRIIGISDATTHSSISEKLAVLSILLKKKRKEESIRLRSVFFFFLYFPGKISCKV